MNRKKMCAFLALLSVGFGCCFGALAAEEAAVWDKTKDVASDVWDGTKEVSSDVWDGAKDVTTDVWNGTKKAASDVKEGLSDDLEDKNEPKKASCAASKVTN